MSTKSNLAKIRIQKILDESNLILLEPYINFKHKLKLKCNKCNLTFDRAVADIAYRKYKSNICQRCRGFKIISKDDLMLLEKQHNITYLNEAIPDTIKTYFPLNVKCNTCSHSWSCNFRVSQKDHYLCPNCANLPKDSLTIIRGIIYKVTGPEGKVYIGQTIQQLYDRKYNHLRHAKNPSSLSYHTKLARAIRLHGEEAFSWNIIHSDIPWNKLNEFEISEIEKHDSYNNGYNGTKGGQDELTASAAKKSYDKRKDKLKQHEDSLETKRLSNFEKNAEAILKQFQKEKTRTKQTVLEIEVKRTLAGKLKYANSAPDSSQYRGVCWDKQHKKWKANIKHQGKKIHIGLFHSEEDAAKAYDEKAKQLHGIKAKLNFQKSI